jgi:hypothetical protein
VAWVRKPPTQQVSRYEGRTTEHGMRCRVAARRATPRQGHVPETLGAHNHDTHTCSPAKIHHGALVSEARRALGTWHGGTPRGGPRIDDHKTQHEGVFSRAADATCLRWQQCDGVTRTMRVVICSWGNGGAPTFGSSKAHTQARLREGKGRARCSRLGEGVVVAGLTKTVARRGQTRWCLASRSVSASSSQCGRPLLARHLVRHSPIHGRPPAAARRRRYDAQLPPLPASSTFPPLRRCSQEWGNPKAGWWEATATPGSSYRVMVKAVQG